MSDLFDAQTKDQIESRMVQTLHTLTVLSFKVSLPLDIIK